MRTRNVVFKHEGESTLFQILGHPEKLRVMAEAQQPATLCPTLVGESWQVRYTRCVSSKHTSQPHPHVGLAEWALLIFSRGNRSRG